MGRRGYTIDDKRAARFEKEGRGQGVGENYKPWLTIRDVPSRGRSHRLVGMTTSRVHHFLSDIEHDLFLLLDWQDSVIDLREQVPLDREMTSRIADALGVRHPRVPHATESMVMTTDLVIDRSGLDGITVEAFAVKPAADLDKPRTLQKLEIERRYWLDQGVPWSIETRAELPKRMVANIAWVHGCFRLDGLSAAAVAALPVLLGAIEQHPSASLRQFCAAMDQQLGLSSGESLTMVRHLIATRAIRCDMASVTLDDQMSVSAFVVADALDQRGRA